MKEIVYLDRGQSPELGAFKIEHLLITGNQPSDFRHIDDDHSNNKLISYFLTKRQIHLTFRPFFPEQKGLRVPAPY